MAQYEFGTTINEAIEGKSMAGIMSFSSLSAALRAGFHIYDRTSDGYLVRTRTTDGWALAVVKVSNPPLGERARGKTRARLLASTGSLLGMGA